MPRWVHPAWKALGIEPTSDTRAIRVAYSAKLKAIDPESDPKAFIALREAFEAAKIQAQWVDMPDDDEDEDEDDEAWDEEEEDGELWAPSGDLYQIRPSGHVPDREAAAGDPASESPAPPEAPNATAEPEPARASPWAPVSSEDADAHARALATLLYNHDRETDPWPSPEQEEAMLAHWRAVAADPRMQEVSYFADAERWFSELITRTAAFSDPLVTPATEFFGWLGSDGAITQTPAVAYVTRRYRMLEFQRAVKQPKHPLNAAWCELTRPAGEGSRRGNASGRKVRQLLRIVRTNYPDLEGCFDWYRVALWDGSANQGSGDGGGGGGGGGWSAAGMGWLFIVVVLALFRLAGSFSGNTPQNIQYLTPVVESQLSNPDADIDQALDTVFGDGKLDLVAIQVRNPKLYRALIDYWGEEKARFVTRPGLAADVDIFLTRWYADGVWRGNAALLADHHALAVDMAKALRADPAACRKFLYSDRLWSERLGLPDSFRERQKALVIRAALETDGSDAHAGGSFSIPGDVVDTAAARAHMNRAAMSAALLFKGSDANQCVGRIAFMEAVLALPRKRGLPIMWKM